MLTVVTTAVHLRLPVEVESRRALLALFEERPVLVVVIGIEESDLQAYHVRRAGTGKIGRVLEFKVQHIRFGGGQQAQARREGRGPTSGRGSSGPAR